MSWEIFKQNMLRTLNNPESINDIDVVAERWAKEYDAAIKRGFDPINQVTLKRGNVDLMKQLFKLALLKGQSSTTPYDLVGEMGKGVQAYWAGAQMNEFPIPLIPAPGSIQNVSVTTNLVTNPGIWTPALSVPGVPEPDLREGPTKDDDMPSSDIGEMEAILGGPVPIGDVNLEPTQFTETEADYFNGDAEEADIKPEDVQTEDEDDDTPLTPEEQAAIEAALKQVEDINNPPEPVLPKINKNVGATAPPIPPGLEKYAVDGKNGTIPADKLGKIKSTYGGGTLHIEAAKMYNKLLDAAIAAGVRWTVSSTYRDYAGQVACWEKYGPGSAAKPGFSPHGWGLALDFSEVCGVQQAKAKELGVGRAKPEPAKYTRENSKLYIWLSINGPKYGWYNPYRLADGVGMEETWHWEYWGFYTLTKAEREA